MPFWGIILLFISVFIFFCVIHYISKSKHPVKRSLLSLSIGIIALSAINLTSGFTGVSLPVSLLSICAAAFGGLPGVTLMLGLPLFF